MRDEIDAAVEKAFTKERLLNKDRRFVHPPYVLESRLRDAIVAGDFDAAQPLLAAINGLERARLSGDPLRSLKNSLVASCTIYTRAAIVGGVDAELAFTLSDTFIRRLDAAREAAALEGFERDMVREFCALVRRYRDEGYDALVARALRTIQAGVMGRVSLRGVAAALRVTPAYLSGAFSRATGRTFTSYVKRAKAEEAKALLRSTAMPVEEVAACLGYARQAYFSRVFKAEAGMTPSEYRKRYGSP